MKTLLLMRHAKSSWDDLACPDHDRALSKRGINAAGTMGAYLQESGLQPDFVLLSSAKRVQETWCLVQPHLTAQPAITTDRNLYFTNNNALLARIQNTGDPVKTLLIINHEPTLGMLTQQLAGDPIPQQCKRAMVKFPTAAIARFDISQNWADLNTGTAAFSQFTTPKDLSKAKF